MGVVIAVLLVAGVLVWWLRWVVRTGLPITTWLRRRRQSAPPPAKRSDLYDPPRYEIKPPTPSGKLVGAKTAEEYAAILDSVLREAERSANLNTRGDTHD